MQNETHYNDDCEEADLQIGAWLENEKKDMTLGSNNGGYVALHSGTGFSRVCCLHLQGSSKTAAHKYHVTHHIPKDSHFKN